MGKKRKLEDAPPVFVEDRAPAAYSHGSTQDGDGGVVKRSDGSGSRCDPELVSYLMEVSQHASAVTDPEERQLLVANVLEEIQGKELRVATDAVTSRLLEALLAGAPGSQLMQFMAAFTNEDLMFSLAGGAFGSHVAEKVLAGLHQQAEQLLQDETQAQQLQELLSGMVGAIGGHLYDYIMDKHATHVARALLVVIAGKDVLSPVAKKKHQQQHGEGEEGGEGAAAGGGAAGGASQQGFKSSKSSLQEKLEGTADPAAAPLRFPALLRRYAKMLPLYEASSMMLLGKNSYSSPFVQAVLRAAAGDQELLQLLLPPILGVDSAKAAAAAPGESLSTLTDSHMGRLLRDDCYSHLLEVVAAVMPAGLRAEFYGRFLKGRLLPLATHHSANFVVQAWLAACSTPQQVQDILGELSVHLPDLLKRRRSGVAAALVAAAGRAGGPLQQAAAVAALAAALTALPQWQGREGTDHLAPALLTLDTNATLSSSNTTSSQQQHHGHGSSTRLSTPGSAMLATLLTHYSKKAAKPFAASVAALSAADVARAAKDPAGSRALQAFIEGGVAGSAAKSGLLAKLAGCWGDVALQGAGSFFLEKAYAWADLDQKEAIVVDVAARQSTLLAGCPWGPLLARKLGLEAYARSPEEWRKRAASASAVIRSFEQLLTDDTPAAAAAAAVGGKKRKKQQQEEQQQQEEEDQQHLTAPKVIGSGAAEDASGKSSKKARKRAKLAAQHAADVMPAAEPAPQATEAAADGNQHERHKKRKHSEGADAAAPAAEAEAGHAGDLTQSKKKVKTQSSSDKDGSTAAAAAAAAAATEQKKKKKRKLQEHGQEAPAAGTGSTNDFVALLGFGGLAAGQQHGSKRHKKS